MSMLQNFLSIIYEFLWKKARVLVPVKLYQPSLMFVGKARSLPSQE